MKKELPIWAIVAAIVAGVGLIVTLWMTAGGNGNMSPAEQKLAEAQSKVQEEHANVNLGGGTPPGSEAAAREGSSPGDNNSSK